MKFGKINREKEGPDGGGGGADHKSMLYLANEYGEMALLETAFDEGWSLKKFQGELLKKKSDEQKEQDRMRYRSAGGVHGADGRGSGGSYQTRSGGGHVVTQSLEDELFANREFEAFRKGRGQRGIDLELKWRPPGLSSRATFLTTTGLTGYDRQPGVVILDQEFARVSSLFRIIQTSLPTIRLTKETSFTNSAAAVAEEGQKPEASFDLEEADTAIRKIAVVGRTSDELMKDFPEAFQYVQSRLRESVELKFDSELINGTGLTDRITGLLSVTGIQTQSTGTYPLIFDAIAAAVNKIQKNGHVQPDAIIVSPDDWLTMRLTKDGQGRYHLGGPGEATLVFRENQAYQGVVWQLPVVVSSLLAQGTAIVGAFARAGFIAMREGLRLEMTNSDASDFQYNRIALRAELRAALVIGKPLAICTVTGITGP